MTDTSEWLRGKLSKSLPRTDFAEGDVRRDVKGIAQAIAALEGRGSIAFGLVIPPGDRADLVPLVLEFREALTAWRDFLANELGDDGVGFVDEIARDHGIRVGPPKRLLCDPLGSAELLTEAQRTAVAKLSEMLSDAASLTDAWRLKEEIDLDEHVGVLIGESDSEELRDLAETFERRYRTAFPPDLALTLSLFNGLAFFKPLEARTSEVVRVRDLGEPVLWPTSFSDHFMFDDVDLHDDMKFFVFGELFDLGWFALGVTDDRNLAGVYWIDSEFSVVDPVRIADDFSDFLSRWSEASLCPSALLWRNPKRTRPGDS